MQTNLPPGIALTGGKSRKQRKTKAKRSKTRRHSK